jgi:pyridinium-3,5-bisthiocarboxylic acid mononucleotide nickel chelatase
MKNKFLKDSIYVVETNIDDMNPVIYETVFEKLYKTGALEVFLAPVQMKKVRPGVLLTALIPKNKLKKIAEIILRETTSFGIRYYEVKRLKLIRKKSAGNSGRDKIGMNRGYLGRELVKISPEYRDCRQMASKRNIPLKNIVW